MKRVITVAASCAVAVLASATAAAASPAGDAAPAGSPGCGNGRTSYTAAAPPGREGQVVHVPDGYDDDRPVPLVLAFHGARSSPATIERFTDLDAADAVVVYPQGRPLRAGEPDLGWAPNDDLADPGPDLDYVTELVGRVQQELCIDPGRVHATGKSQGGGFTYALACERPDLVSSIAPVAGAFYRPGVHHGIADCGSGPRSVLEIHGDADSTITYDGRDDEGTGLGRARAIRTVTTGGTLDEGWVDEWVRRNGCGSEDTAPPVRQGARVQQWSHCADGSRVVHYRISGGGHDWPGSTDRRPETSCVSDVTATRTVLEFFGVGTTRTPARVCS